MAADKASGNSRPTMPGNTYTIGQLAKLLGLPTSTLRYYDAQGLLTPALRDETNQYRYYTEEQVMEAMNIIQLKRLGISLQDIKLILQHKRLLDLNQNLADKMAEYQKQIEQ